MLIVISESDFRPQEAAIVNGLFRAGLDLFHIRKYEASEKELSELIAQIEPEHRQKLVLNHHHELGLSLGLKRFHYSERDRKEWQKANWKEISRNSLILLLFIVWKSLTTYRISSLMHF